MTTNRLTRLVLACALTALPNLASAEGRGSGHPPPPPPPPMSEAHGGIPDRLVERLDLSDEQAAVIEELASAREEATAGSRELLRSLHDQMKSLWAADTLDREALYETSRQISETRALIDEERVRFRIGFIELLTSEQREELAKAEKRRRPRRPPRGLR